MKSVEYHGRIEFRAEQGDVGVENSQEALGFTECLVSRYEVGFKINVQRKSKQVEDIELKLAIFEEDSLDG